MKTSLEHNRAHLQRELYAKEGEINRLQCALRVMILTIFIILFNLIDSD